jgi:hypothetical protein
VIGFYIHDNMNFIATERRQDGGKDVLDLTSRAGDGVDMVEAGAIGGAYAE